MQRSIPLQFQKKWSENRNTEDHGKRSCKVRNTTSNDGTSTSNVTEFAKATKHFRINFCRFSFVVLENPNKDSPFNVVVRVPCWLGLALYKPK